MISWSVCFPLAIWFLITPILLVPSYFSYNPNWVRGRERKCVFVCVSERERESERESERERERDG